MLSVEQLIAESRDPRLQKLPMYARDLIHDLAHRMEAEAIARQAVMDRAAKEVDEIRTLLSKGPEDSDTFMAIPRTVIGDDEIEEKPLGQGTVIEFRQPDMETGEGFEVSLNDGSLLVQGINHLTVIPVSLTSLRIETR
jgi:hypothetical protein